MGKLTKFEKGLLDAGMPGRGSQNLGEESSTRSSDRLQDKIVASALTVEEAARRMDADAAFVREEISSRRLYAVDDADRGKVLPLFQFVEDGGLVPKIGDVFTAHPEITDPKEFDPVEMDTWLRTPNPDLYLDEDQTPLCVLDYLSGGGDLAGAIDAMDPNSLTF